MTPTMMTKEMYCVLPHKTSSRRFYATLYASRIKWPKSKKARLTRLGDAPLVAIMPAPQKWQT